MPEKALNVEIKGYDEIRTAFKRSPQVFANVFNKAIKKAIFVLESNAKVFAPVDTGFLRGAGMKTTFSALIGTLKNIAPYAVFVHEGTKPHWPPLAAITPWAERHGIPPFVVARSIAKKGTKPKPFFKESIEESQRDIDEIFENALKEFNLSL